MFLVLVSAVQIASAVWWCARRDDEPGIMEAEHPQCGPPHFKYQLVVEFPGCEDQRYEAWRLLACCHEARCDADKACEALAAAVGDAQAVGYVFMEKLAGTERLS